MIRYYLHTKSEKVWEIDPKTGADLDGHNLFSELSSKEKKFYLQCIADGYTPTGSEIKEQKRAERTQISLEDYKASKIAHLDWISLETAKKLLPEYKINNARLSVELFNLDPEKETVYDFEASVPILEEANRIAILCRYEFYRISKKIEKAKTIEAVDVAFNSNEYDTFE